jgi:homoserine O-succinyltransferase
VRQPDMPVFVDNIAQGHHLYTETEQARERPKNPLTIGLVNNMPDGALVSTERQLFDLLQAASEDLPIRLRFYALPTVVRSDRGREYVNRSYLGVNALCGGTLDGLIVTGAEPLASQLTEEPYWSDLGQVIDWAKSGANSTIWSCLAARREMHRHIRADSGNNARFAGRCATEAIDAAFALERNS